MNTTNGKRGDLVSAVKVAKDNQHQALRADADHAARLQLRTGDATHHKIRGINHAQHRHCNRI